MARSSDTLIEDSKKYINNFYSSGSWLKEPIPIQYGGKPVSNYTMLIMEKYYRLLLESTMLNDCTRLYLTSNMKGVKDAVEKYNQEHLEIDWINLNTAQSKVQYDKKKLDKYFEKDILLSIITYPEKFGEKFETTIDTLARVYMNDNEYNQSMVIRFPKEMINKEITDDEWSKLIKLVETYSKLTIRNIESDESYDNIVGYFNYIISCSVLSEQDTERLKKIREVLGL
jgi:hypothetical protein